LFSAGPEDPEDDTEMDKHGAEGLNSTTKSVMYVTQAEDTKVRQDVAHRMI